MAARAISTAKFVAARIEDPEIIIRYAASRRDAMSLSRGHAGTALLFSYLERIDGQENWALLSHSHIQASVAAIHEAETDLGIGLFAGVSGLALSASLIGGSDRYLTLRSQLDDFLLPAVSKHIARIPRRRNWMHTHEFDLVSGITGIGVYLVTRCKDAPLLISPRECLDSLIERLLNILSDGSLIPKWSSKPDKILEAFLAKRCPEGLLNIGFAHGLPGALTLATELSRQDNRFLPLVKDWSGWLLQLRKELGYWPDIIPISRIKGRRNVDTANAVPARVAWCYGTGGIFHALLQASRRIDDAAMKMDALNYLIEDVSGILKRNLPKEVTLCHGKAGLLQILLRAHNLTSDIRLKPLIHDLVHSLLLELSADNPFGFLDWTPEAGHASRPGLLTGASGVALALLSAASNVEPEWDRAMLLS